LITQSTFSDCGPAALATLLNFYLDVPTKEAEIARLSQANQYGTTLLGLEQATQAKGCGADSFRMNLATLRQQLAAYPAPVLVRLLNPQPHFALVLAIESDTVFMADPASGNTLLPLKRFLQRWQIAGSDEGYVLIAARADGRPNVKRRNETVADMRRQQAMLRNPPLAPAPRH
jgi:predicted double-glycine peptidase